MLAIILIGSANLSNLLPSGGAKPGAARQPGRLPVCQAMQSEVMDCFTLFAMTITCLAMCKEVHYTFFMIESFVHKGLSELFETGKSAKIQKALANRALRRLDAIDTAKTPEALNVPGFDFHGLQGKPKRYSVHVNGPWCITFEWQGEDAVKLDFENYH
jgi:proteic killer suppression protein